MSSTLTPSRERLVSTEKMNRDDVLELFVRVTNLVKPDHKYDIEYPICTSEVEYSYCTRYYAKCGPRKIAGNSAYFASNMNHFNNFSQEFALAVMCHELGHLKYGIEKGQPTHPPIFWQKMAEYAMMLVIEWDEVNSWFETDVSQSKFKKCVVNEPNSFTVDRRIESVRERREEMTELMNTSKDLVIDSNKTLLDE